MRHSTQRAPTRMLRVVGSLLLVAGLSACDAKLDDFFAPADDVVPLPGGFPTAEDLNGSPITVSYTTRFTDCEASLPPFTADADLSTSGSDVITLNVLFSDAPVPISGIYVEDTGEYEGTTGLVDLGGGAFAEEMWMLDLRKSSGTVTGTGLSDVVFSGTEDCRREFSISFSYSLD